MLNSESQSVFLNATWITLLKISVMSFKCVGYPILFSYGDAVSCCRNLSAQIENVSLRSFEHSYACSICDDFIRVSFYLFAHIISSSTQDCKD